MHDPPNPSNAHSYFAPLTATLGGGGKYIPAEPAAPPALFELEAAAISSSTFLSALLKPGVNGLPGKVGLLKVKRVEKFGLFGAAPPLALSLAGLE